MSLSKIAQAIGTSATIKLNETANALRAQGVPVIHLGGGEPKSKAPKAAIKAAAEKLQTGEIRYTPTAGIIPLKRPSLNIPGNITADSPSPETSWCQPAPSRPS